MIDCKTIKNQIPLYVDAELGDSELISFEDHITNCASCQSELDAEQKFSDNIRNSFPPYKSPIKLRKKVEDIVHPAKVKSIQPIKLHTNRVYVMTLAAAAVIILVLGGTLFWHINFAPITATLKEEPSELAKLAVATHLKRLGGGLPLEVTAGSPGEISKWFVGKVPFNLKLPNYEDTPEQEKLYKIVGGRLIGYKQDYAAYVTYQMHDKPISLVATSEEVSKPTGNRMFALKDLTFYLDEVSGLKVFIWSRRGLTYALVSDLDEYGQQSCMVCHPGGNIQDRVRVVKPKT